MNIMVPSSESTLHQGVIATATAGTSRKSPFHRSVRFGHLNQERMIQNHFYRPRTKYEGRYCFYRCLSVHICGGIPLPRSGWGATDSQIWTGGYLIPGQDGTPDEVSGLRVPPPHQDWMGYPPPIQDWIRYTPVQNWMGLPPAPLPSPLSGDRAA